MPVPRGRIFSPTFDGLLSIQGRIRVPISKPLPGDALQRQDGVEAHRGIFILQPIDEQGDCSLIPAVAGLTYGKDSIMGVRRLYFCTIGRRCAAADDRNRADAQKQAGPSRES